MRTRLDDRGVTLAELLVVSVLMSVVIVSTYLLLGTTQNISNVSMAQSLASDEAQHAVDMMTSEIRQAQENEEGHGAFTIAEPSRVQFFFDANGDGRPELITYYVDSGKLYRTVTPATNTEPPFTFGPPGVATTIISHLDSSEAIFCYHGTEINDTVVCAGGYKHGFSTISTADPYSTSPKITMVGLYLVNQQSFGDRTVSVITDVLARVRSVQNIVK